MLSSQAATSPLPALGQESGSSDSLHAITQPLNVDGLVIAKINSVQSPGCAGVLIRENQKATSQGAAVYVSSTGTLTFAKRLYAFCDRDNWYPDPQQPHFPAG